MTTTMMVDLSNAEVFTTAPGLLGLALLCGATLALVRIGLWWRGRRRGSRRRHNGYQRSKRVTPALRPDSRHVPLWLRRAVYRRDEGRCVVCGSRKDLELDHDIPWSRAGATTPENLQLLCRCHNRQKAAKIW